MKLVSIIIPCYNEESNLMSLFQNISSFMNEHNKYLWQILLIDDGSRDNTFSMIKKSVLKIIVSVIYTCLATLVKKMQCWLVSIMSKEIAVSLWMPTYNILLKSYPKCYHFGKRALTMFMPKEK